MDSRRGFLGRAGPAVLAAVLAGCQGEEETGDGPAGDASAGESDAGSDGTGGDEPDGTPTGDETTVTEQRDLPPREGPGPEGAWPLGRVDLARTGAVDTAAPTGTVTERWRVGTDASTVDSGPVLVDGTVYVGDRGGTVHALAAADGAEQWRADIGGEVRSSVAVVGESLYVGNGPAVVALDRASGAEQWRVEVAADRIESSPAVVDGTVYVGAGTDLYALATQDGSVRWHVEFERDVRTSPAVADGRVHVGDGTGTVSAFDAVDGSTRWEFDVPKPEVVGGPVAYDGELYAVAGRAGGSSGSVHALDAADGTERWAVELPDSISLSPAVTGETVYVGSPRGDESPAAVLALDRSDGSERWRVETRGPFSTPDSPPVLADGTLVTGDVDGYVYGFSTAEAAELWQHEVGYSVGASTAVVDGTVYATFHTRNGTGGVAALAA